MLFYELVCGTLPFGEDEKDPIEVYRAIMTTKVKFPNWIESKYLRKIIRKLMRKNPEKRKKLTYEIIKGNTIFDGIKWVTSFLTNQHFIHHLIEKHFEKEVLCATSSRAETRISLKEEDGRDVKALSAI